MVSKWPYGCAEFMHSFTQSTGPVYLNPVYLTFCDTESCMILESPCLKGDRGTFLGGRFRTRLAAS
eukprot:1158929-Pelagomonas_calceolata.AAC.1